MTMITTDKTVMSSLLYTIMAILSVHLLKHMNTSANVHVIGSIVMVDDWLHYLLTRPTEKNA